MAKLTVTCERPPVSFSNDTCRHTFNLYISPKLAHRPDRLKKIKQDIAQEYLQGQLWRSFFPYGFMQVIGKPVTLHHWRHPELFHVPDLSMDEMLATAIESLREIRAAHAKVLVTLHPVFWDVFPKPVDYRLTTLMTSQDPSLNVVIMRDRMPFGRGEKEAYTWYNLPYDGHMSNKGGALYAQILGEVIKERIAERGS